MRALVNKPRDVGMAGAIFVAACGGNGSALEERGPETVAFEDETPASDGGRGAPSATPEVLRAEELLASGNSAEAKEVLERVVEATPGDARAWFDLGLVGEMEGDAALAEQAYARALDEAPQFAEALNNLGLLFRNLDRVAEALPLLRRAALLEPSDPATLQNLAYALEETGDFEGARPVYRDAVRAAPRDGRLRANYGLLLVSLGREEEAARELRQALDIAEADAATLLAIGNGLRRIGHVDAVRAMERAALAAGEDVTPALLSELALAQRAGGDRPAAEETLARALSLDSRYGTAHYLLANMQAARSAFREAIAHYRRYLALEPDGPLAAQARERLRAAEAAR